MTTEPNKLPATFDRPTKAKLLVVAENGESWEPSAADLKRFGLIDAASAAQRWRSWARDIIGAAPEDTELSVIAYSVDCALLYSHMPGDEKAYNAQEAAEDRRKVRELAATEHEDNRCAACGVSRGERCGLEAEAERSGVAVEGRPPCFA